MLTVVAKIGAKVRWHGQGDKVKLEPATIRGVKSDGMICAAVELDLPIADRSVISNRSEKSPMLHPEISRPLASK